MRLKDSPYACEIISENTFSWGSMFNLKNSVVVEINEGVNFGETEFTDTYNFMVKAKGNTPFYLIVNRLYAFSINPMALYILHPLESLIIYTYYIVYKKNDELVTNFEKQFHSHRR